MGKQALTAKEKMWLKIIKECRSSGSTDKDWCEERGISTGSFYRYIRILQNKGWRIPERMYFRRPDTAPDGVQNTEDSQGTQNTEAENIEHRQNTLQKDTQDDSELAVQIACHEFKVKITNATDPEMLLRVLSAMMKAYPPKTFKVPVGRPKLLPDPASIQITYHDIKIEITKGTDEETIYRILQALRTLY